MLGGKLFFYLAIVVDAAFLSVDKQNFARFEATFRHHIGGLKVHHAHFRSHHHHTALGDGVARWAQTVAVEHTAGITSVGEHQRSGAVPRLHQY